MIGDMAIRLWAVSAALANGQADETEMRLILSEVCDDVAIKLAELSGTRYHDNQDAINNESFEPTYKFTEGD